LLIWSAWFFLAPVTLYETGQIVGATRDGTVVADFPAEAAGRILPGQPALLHLQGALAAEAGALPASVMEVAEPTGQDHVRVELYPQWDADLLTAPENGLRGQVEVEVERVSPAYLFLHTAGQFLSDRPVSFSPGHQ
jgi:hypothetical protein